MAVHSVAAHHYRSVAAANNQIEKLEKREEKRVSTERTRTRQIVDVALNQGGAFGMGLLHGRKGGMPETWGIPWDAGLGVLTTGLGIAASKSLGKYSDPVIALGSGFLCYFSGSMGAQLGQSMRKNAGEMVGTVPDQSDYATKNNLSMRTVVAGPPAMGYGGMPGYVPPTPQWNPAAYGFVQ
jgi:hypothetical protein